MKTKKLPPIMDPANVTLALHSVSRSIDVQTKAIKALREEIEYLIGTIHGAKDEDDLGIMLDPKTWRRVRLYEKELKSRIEAEKERIEKARKTLSRKA